jgi:hypothetical protein
MLAKVFRSFQARVPLDLPVRAKTRRGERGPQPRARARSLVSVQTKSLF